MRFSSFQGTATFTRFVGARQVSTADIFSGSNQMPKTATQNIEVDVRAAFVPEKSNPEKAYYFFAYTIRITNLGGPPAKLLNRHWVITDGLGRVHEVKG